MARGKVLRKTSDLGSLYETFMKEFDIPPFIKYHEWSKKKKQKHNDEIREWLKDIVDNNECLELEDGRQLDVILEYVEKNDKNYYTVRYKGIFVFSVSAETLED